VLSKLATITDKQAAINGFFHQYINYMRSGHDQADYFVDEIGKLIPTPMLLWRVVDADGNISTTSVTYEAAKERLKGTDVVFKEAIFDDSTATVAGVLVADRNSNPTTYSDDCTMTNAANFEETVPLLHYDNTDYDCGDCNTPEEYEEFEQEKKFELANTMVGYNPEVIFCVDHLYDDVDDTAFRDDNERDRNQERALNRITNKLAPYLNDVPKARGADKDAVKHLAHTLKRVEDHDGMMAV
jgi:hypothetical protein